MQTWAGCLLACLPTLLLACLPLHQKSQSLSSKKRASKSCSSLYYLIISKLKPITHRLLPAPSAPTGKLAHLHRAKSQVRNGCAHSYMHMCAHTHTQALTHTHTHTHARTPGALTTQHPEPLLAAPLPPLPLCGPQTLWAQACLLWTRTWPAGMGGGQPRWEGVSQS